MAAPISTTVNITNASGDTATLVSSTYENAPNTIKSGESVAFEQDTSLDHVGSVMYAIGKMATWVVLWTVDNQVTTWILPPDTPVIWKYVWNTLQFDPYENSYPTGSGGTYNSNVDISSTGDAQTLNAKISYT
ncbi:hypothetical protein V6N13_149483 [Hibiscus sabdariffa]|uniref:Uncharacterized protein n=1 Tax=Hibiscus sabdariffa TaxID=183260 RepID=A0ABR2EH70_9ROSI